MSYTARVWRDGNWWCGQIVEVPGALAQERTHSELLESLRIALAEMTGGRIDEYEKIIPGEES